MDIYVKNFTTAPGGRYQREGKFSGEEFRKKYLEPLFKKPNSQTAVKIYLDGVEGYPSSFLEEAFGGLVRIVKDKELVKSRLDFITEDPILKTEIESYIENAL